MRGRVRGAGRSGPTAWGWPHLERGPRADAAGARNAVRPPHLGGAVRLAAAGPRGAGGPHPHGQDAGAARNHDWAKSLRAT